MPTTIGGKDPTRQPKKKLPLLMIVAHGEPKGDAPSANEPPSSTSKGTSASQPPAPPDDKYAGKGPSGKTIQPGEAQFHNQTQTCSTCEYFDPQGNDGVGECKMGVPEADFQTSDPDASWCKYWEANDDATETPEQEQAENEPAEPAGVRS